MDPQETGEKETAVILNKNARRVTRKVVRKAEELVPKIALYTSRTKEEAYQIYRDLMDRGVRRIISGGGDGTFFYLVSLARKYFKEQKEKLLRMGRYAREELSKLSMPEFGILKLGTGNSFAPLLGLKRGLKPVEMLADGENFRTRQVHVLEAEDRCFTFCGMGWDAQILNDYLWMKNRAQKTRVFARYMQSLMGYFTAIAFRTIPKVLLGRKKNVVTIRNLGERVYSVQGDESLRLMDCAKGDIIYQGPCNVAGVATTPYYGFKLKAFPYAMREPGFMHVRVISASVFELLAHAWRIWHGTYKSPRFIEFLAEKAHFSFSEDMPIQIGGDAEGYRKEFSIEVADFTVELLDFSQPIRRLLPPPATAQDTPDAAEPQALTREPVVPSPPHDDTLKGSTQET